MERNVEVLLIEDSDADVVLLEHALRKAKSSVTMVRVKDGEQAMHYMRNSANPRPDIVFCDLNMPNMDGREVLGEMSLDERLRRIPVVVLTSSKSEADIVKSYALGASAYVAKPVGLEAMRDVVDKISGFWFTVVRYPA